MNALVLATLLQVDVIPFEKNPWDGFAPDSAVRMVIVDGGKTREVALTRVPHDRLRTDDGEVPIAFMQFSQFIKAVNLPQTGKSVETVLGQKARVEEYSAYDGVNTGRIRLSLADGIPGGVAKLVVDIEAGGKREQVRHEAKAVERIEVARRKVQAVRFEYARESAEGEKVKATYWLSSEVPGLTAKYRGKTTFGKDVREKTIDVIDFETKRK